MSLAYMIKGNESLNSFMQTCWWYYSASNDIERSIQYATREQLIEAVDLFLKETVIGWYTHELSGEYLLEDVVYIDEKGITYIIKDTKEIVDIFLNEQYKKEV